MELANVAAAQPITAAPPIPSPSTFTSAWKAGTGLLGLRTPDAMAKSQAAGTFIGVPAAYRTYAAGRLAGTGPPAPIITDPAKLPAGVKGAFGKADLATKYPGAAARVMGGMSQLGASFWTGGNIGGGNPQLFSGPGFQTSGYYPNTPAQIAANLSNPNNTTYVPNR